MQLIEPQIATYCLGQAASMGAVLLAGGSKGKRYALPHSRVMIHQPWGGAQGTAMDMEIHVKEILKMKATLEEILAKHSGKSVREVNKACERDNFMSPKEALDFGLIDQVVAREGETK
jgi:ATP-dependent Clp protease protease subunit